MFARTMWIAVIASLTFVSITETAYARRDRRDGFNFGTQLRLLEADDKRYAGNHSDKDVKADTTGQAVSPYVGYAFSPMNLGLALHVDQTESTINETIAESDKRIKRESSSSLKGASVFVRFLFGKYFFFEAAGGVYSEKTQIKNTYTSELGDGLFNGEEEEYTVNGMGPGYNVGGGLEVPMGNGFYFTTAYLVRIVQLRDTDNGSAFGGDKLAYRQSREIAFGIAHYVK